MEQCSTMTRGTQLSPMASWRMLKRTRERLRIEWRVPAYLPYLHARLTDAAVKKAEGKIGFKLPKAYIDALRAQNGGYLRFSLGNTGAKQLWGIGSRFPSILEGSVAERCGDDDDAWKPRDAHRLVPFAGDGHWYLCFDGRGGRGEPAITYVDLECARSKKVADTFEQLVEKRGQEEERELVGLVTDLVIDEVAKRLGKTMRLKMTDQGDWAHGYRTLHGSAKSGAQMWITPNEVPRGFVRKEDPDYAKLVKRLPGTALRMPEQPDVGCLIQVADLAIDDVVAACHRAGLTARRV